MLALQVCRDRERGVPGGAVLKSFGERSWEKYVALLGQKFSWATCESRESVQTKLEAAMPLLSCFWLTPPNFFSALVFHSQRSEQLLAITYCLLLSSVLDIWGVCATMRSKIMRNVWLGMWLDVDRKHSGIRVQFTCRGEWPLWDPDCWPQGAG